MNNYHIYEEIGRGKYSVVYKGRKKRTIEYMAVKSLEKCRKNKVLNEVKIFHQLNHPNVMKYYNWYETRNHLWIIFEYCSGGDLLTLIEQDKKLPESLVRNLIRDLTSALQYLHSKGIVYCDLKPSNVLLNEYGQLKICDFGLSRRIVDMIQTLEDTKEGAKKGTPCYMAPELFQDDGVCSFQSDFWALGCVMYELATGKPPFVSNSFQDLIGQILNKDVPKIINFSSEFNDLIDKLLQKNPLKRLSWDQLLAHSFWSNFCRFPVVEMPSQPHFERWVLNSKYGIGYQIQQHNSNTPKIGSNVNILRLSLNVQKNLHKELNDYSNQQQNNDVEINNMAQIINMGGGDDEEQEDYAFDQNNNNSGCQYQQDVADEQKNNIDFNYSQFHSVKPNDQIQQMDSRNKNNSNNNNNANNIKTQVIVPVNELFTHNSDNSVKPIIGNKEIEKQGEQNFNKEALPFQCFTSDEVSQGIETQLIESHLENIFNSLVNGVGDKQYNILCYFETITQNSNAANRLINSAFMNLLLKLLKTCKQQQTKIKIGSILGLLIRHATVIENELGLQGIPQILIETIKSEKSEKVKRRCIAALGEYLFYGATQIDEDPTNSNWQMSGNVVQFMVKTLRTDNEDEFVKYYAIKTIENITAQSVETGQYFANTDCCLAIIQLYLNSTNEGLKVSTMVSLQHIAMLNNSLSDLILGNLGSIKNPPYGNLKDILSSGQNRVQQALLTIINLQILISESQLTQWLLNDLEFIDYIVHLFDNASLVVRGKAILSIFLIIKVNSRALILLGQTKFFSFFEKIGRDNQKYVQQCFSNLKQLLIEMISYILQMILDELNRISKGELADNSSNYYQEVNFNQFVPVLNGNLQYLSILLQYAGCSFLSLSLFKQNYLEVIFELLNIAKDANQEVKCILVNLYEVLLGNKQLLNHSDYFVDVVVPKLFDQLKLQADQNMKFNYLKLIFDILNLLLSEENSHFYVRMQDFFFKNFINSQLAGLLNSAEEQVQIIALKLLNLLVQKQPKIYVQALKQNKLVNKIIESFTTNRTALRLAAYIIQCSNLQEINSYNISKVSVELFKHYILKQQDQCYEDLVDIFLNITTKLIGNSGINLERPSVINENIESYEYLIAAYDSSYSLLNSIDFSLSEKVGIFIIQMIFLFGKNKKMFKSEYIVNILNTINQYSMVNTMMRRNVRVLNWQVQILDIGKELKDSVFFTLEKIKKCDDQKVVSNINEMKFFLSK